MELIVRVVDKINVDDSVANLKLTKRGDIIAMVDDGHNWGTKDKSSPDWRIIKMPGLKKENFAHWMLPDNRPESKDKPNRRLHKINLDSPLLSKAFVDDASRTNAAITVARGASTLALKK